MVEHFSKGTSPPKRATHTSLTRGLRILETLAAGDGPATLSDTARKVDLPRSTTYHIMQTLTQLGYLRQNNESRTYELGEKIFDLTGNGTSTARIAELALPILKDICAETGENAAIAALFGNQVTIVATHDADGPVRVVQDVGAHRPIHGTALGKALVAWLSEEDQKDLLSRIDLERHTSKTIVQRSLFEAELQRVRNNGVAFDHEEFLTGVRCIAAPVFTKSGHVVAALGLTGPRQRLQQRKMRELAPLVQHYANMLSERISNIS